MTNITDIYEMLDWNKPSEIQSRGRELAQGVENLELFIQPLFLKYNKNIWDNCARILASKSDDELSLYFVKLFEWLQDMNWPGACLIYDRLLCAKKESIDFAYQHSLKIAKQSNDCVWEKVLKGFYADFIVDKTKK